MFLKGREGWIMRNNRKASYVFSFLIGFMLILGTNFALSQKHFYMKEKQMYEKFKMATKYFEKGKSYFQNEKFKKAEEEFNTCIEKMPEHVYAHFYLTQICESQYPQILLPAQAISPSIVMLMMVYGQLNF